MREYCFDIIYATLEKKKHSDEMFLWLCKKEKEKLALARDRHLVQREALGTIERVIELDEYLNAFSNTPVCRMHPVIRTILRMGAYELFYMDSIPASATCNEMVLLAKKRNQERLAGFVNAILRNLAREDGKSYGRRLRRRRKI